MSLHDHPGYYQHDGLGASDVNNFGQKANAIALGRSLLNQAHSEKTQVIIYMKDMGFSPRTIMNELIHRGFTVTNHRQTETMWRQIYDKWFEVGESYLNEHGDEVPVLPKLYSPHIDLLVKTDLALASSQDLRAELRSFGKSTRGKPASLRKKVQELRNDFLEEEGGDPMEVDMDVDGGVGEAEGGVEHTGEGFSGVEEHQFGVHSN